MCERTVCTFERLSLWNTRRGAFTFVVVPVLLALVMVGCGETRDGETAQDRPSTTAGTTAGSQTSEEGCGDDRVPEGALDVAGMLWVHTCLGADQTASVSLHDLNGDGVSDVVVDDPSFEDDSGVVALNGADGSQLWQSEAQIQMITIARFADLNDDGAVDVLVGGRGIPEDERPLVAIDGTDGSTIWRVEPLEPGWGNAFTPQDLGDLTGDGVLDWLVATGGDHIRAAMDPPTVAGRLMVVDGGSGKLVGSVALPEPQEIYNSPVLVHGCRSDSAHVLVGSGGEVFPGSVWRIPVDAVTGQSMQVPSRHSCLAMAMSSFIAPYQHRLISTDDGRLEAVVVRLDGLVSVLDSLQRRTLVGARPAL